METYPGNVDGLKGYRFNGSAWSYSPSWVRRGGYQKISYKTPGWKTMTRKDRQKAAWLPFNEDSEEWELNRGYATGFNWAAEEWDGYYGNDLPVTGNGFASTYGKWNMPTGDAYKKALSKVQTKISQSAVNLAQAMAERKQTADLLAKSFNRLVQMVLLVRKGKFNDLYLKYGVPPPRKTQSGAWARPRYMKVERKYSRAFDEQGNPLAQPRTVTRTQYVDLSDPNRKIAFGDVWLELQYGWKPLLQDIYGSAELLARLHGPDYRPIRFASTAEDELSIRPLWIGQWSINGTYFDVVAHQRVEERVRVIIEADEDSQLLQLLANTGATNPANLAWELLPYSFVVDWFIPIGNWLQQLEYARGMTFRRGMVVTKRKGGASVQHVYNRTLAGYSKGRQTGAEINIRKEIKVRTLLGSFPYQKFPSFTPKLGIERILTAGALLQQLMTTGKTTVRR